MREFLRDCGHYIVIGTSGQDEDLLAFLRETAPRGKTAHYVSDTELNAKLTAERMGEVCKADRVSLFFNGGFRRYLDSEPFRDLLKSLRQ